ncbi:hypothetical protein BV898_06588 [Hypsibius exemplaris]|uniref:Uncharacterized protein n=1 Tax=Hypsibius exemplaris TaxID=2072580 RepID=A0A1W0WW35_HYPEX|nr:hypothetical protein BV898_06588 [Hypsibius exemplaris]
MRRPCAWVPLAPLMLLWLAGLCSESDALDIFPYLHDHRGHSLQALMLSRSRFGAPLDMGTMRMVPAGKTEPATKPVLPTVPRTQFSEGRQAYSPSRRFFLKYGKRATVPSSLRMETHMADGTRALECLANDDATTRAICPGIDKNGRYRCIEHTMLCDGKPHCPNGEDENEIMCMFHKLTLHHIGTYGQTLSKWMLPL